MKKYISMALAAMALVSCSNDEFLEINQEAISFGEAFVDNATRAYDPSYGANANALTQFNVWGAVEGTVDGTSQWSSIFANDVVEGKVGSTDGTVNVWNCTSKTQYWIPGANYKFAAVVNGGTDLSKFTVGDYNIPTAVTFTSTDGQQDLLYADAIATGAASDNPLVDFTFKHMLAKVVFAVENTTNSQEGNQGQTSPYYYKVTGVKILNPMVSGKCTFGATPIWEDRKQSATAEAAGAYFSLGDVTSNTASSTLENMTAIEIHDRASKDETTSHRACLLIPYNYKTEATTLTENNYRSFQVEYTVSLYLEVDTDPTHDVLISQEKKQSAITIDIKPGYSYRLLVTLGLGNPIQFSVKENPIGWETPTGE